MYLVICSAEDASGLWAFQELQARGLRPLELIGAESIARSLTWEHRIRERGASVRIRLADGRVVDSARVQGTLNRIRVLNTDHIRQVPEPDRRYAEQELNAFFLSWLHSLPGTTLNRPTPRGLSGAWRPVSEWAVLAARSRLSTPELVMTSDGGCRWEPSGTALSGSVSRVHVVEGRVVEDVPETVREGCRTLAELAESGILAVEFLQVGSELLFVGATSWPELVAGGAPLADALFEALSVGVRA